MSWESMKGLASVGAIQAWEELSLFMTESDFARKVGEAIPGINLVLRPIVNFYVDLSNPDDEKESFSNLGVDSLDVIHILSDVEDACSVDTDSIDLDDMMCLSYISLREWVVSELVKLNG